MSNKIRFIINKEGIKYLRQEDVVSFIKECAGAEETDVRNRFNKVAEELNK